MPQHKMAKDWLMHILDGNAAGDTKLKLLLVSQSENRRALKRIKKLKLPLIWMLNMEAWLTVTVFENWFTEYFCPVVKSYYSFSLPIKALLILDNALAHPPYLNILSSNVKVVFLPPNTTCVLHPTDQGMIAILKAYYIRKTLSVAVKIMSHNEGTPTLKEFVDHIK
jgi:hypothetical protein